MVNILKYDKIDLSNINILKPEKVGKYYYSRIRYDDEPLYIQTDRLKNLKSMEFFDKRDPYLELEIPMKMYDVFSKLDDKVLSSTNENWDKWMNKQIPLEVFEKMYNKITTPFKVDDLPTIKLKLPISKSELLTKVFDDDKVDCTIENLKENMETICIYNIKGIKYNEKTFYCDAYVTQIKVFRNSTKSHEIPDQCLIDTEEEIDENDVIDQQELQDLLKQDKIKMLYNQKREELRLIEQIKIRIENIDQEIKDLQ